MTGKNIGGHSIGAPSKDLNLPLNGRKTSGDFAAARLGDRCSGHGCFPPRPNNEASTDVFWNDLGAHRQTDSYEIHCCGDSCHGGELAEGSSTVFINDLPIGRVTDPVSCGSAIIEGSPNVFFGD